MAVKFDVYLREKLQKIKIDAEVFGAYILGILEAEDENEEKVEALTDILSGVMESESDVNTVVEEIMQKWNESHPKVGNEQTEKPPEVEDRLVKLLESQKLATNKVKQYTEEEKKIREQILSQYKMTEVEEEDFVDSDEGEGGLEKNTNASDVQQRVKERRENAKLESQMKKQKDKEDREKQKQLREEKKEKRKTVKGERRR